MLQVPHFPSSPDLPAAGPACPLFTCSRSGSTSGSTVQLLTLQAASFGATLTLFFPVAQAKNLESSLTPFPHTPLLIQENAVSHTLQASSEPNHFLPTLLQQPRWAKQLRSRLTAMGEHTSWLPPSPLPVYSLNNMARPSHWPSPLEGSASEFCRLPFLASCRYFIIIIIIS